MAATLQASASLPVQYSLTRVPYRAATKVRQGRATGGTRGGRCPLDLGGLEGVCPEKNVLEQKQHGLEVYKEAPPSFLSLICITVTSTSLLPSSLSLLSTHLSLTCHVVTVCKYNSPVNILAAWLYKWEWQWKSE